MKKILYLFVFLPLLTWAKPFPGHVFYTITYNKPYTSGLFPTELSVELFVRKHQRAVSLLAGYQGKKKRVIRYIFDDQKKLLWMVNMTDKKYAEYTYENFQAVGLTEVTDPKLIPKPIKVFGEDLKAKVFKHTKNGWLSSVYYSSYTDTPFTAYRMESQNMIEPGTGRIALAMTKQVAPGISAIYVAKVIDSQVSDEIFKIPKDFKKM